jgi:hypothetical protein
MRNGSIATLTIALFCLIAICGCQDPATVENTPKEVANEFNAPLGGALYRMIDVSDTTTFIITPEQMKRYAAASIYLNGNDTSLIIDSRTSAFLTLLSFQFPRVSAVRTYRIGAPGGSDFGKASLEMSLSPTTRRYFNEDTGSMNITQMDLGAHELSARFQMTMIEDAASADTVRIIGEFNRIEYSSYLEEKASLLTYEDGNVHGAYPLDHSPGRYNSLTKTLELEGRFGYYPSPNSREYVEYDLKLVIRDPRVGTLNPTDSSEWSFTHTVTPDPHLGNYHSETTHARSNDTLVITEWNVAQRKISGYLLFSDVGRFELSNVLWQNFK